MPVQKRKRFLGLRPPPDLRLRPDPGHPLPVTPPALEAPILAPPQGLNPLAVRTSLEQVTASPQVCAGDFYGYLFAARPELRDMFPPQMDTQNERLFAALVRITKLLDRPDALAQYLVQLGADHRKYGVRSEHYAMVSDALIRALRRHSPAWSDAAEGGWQAALSVASHMMIAGASSISGPPWWEGRILHHERRSDDLAVLTIQTGQPLPYLPGQYVTVQTSKWPRVWRQFSVANAPRLDGTMDIHVRSIPGGWVSPVLVKNAVDDGRVMLGPAMGGMVPSATGSSDLLCVAGGTGLAPLKALAQAVLEGDEAALSAGRGRRRAIHLFHGARTPLDLYDMPELRRLADCYPWLNVVPVVSRDPEFAGHRGHVSDVLAGYPADWKDHQVFVSGPSGMVQSTAEALAGAGVPEAQVHFDEAALLESAG
jgi:NAD(P)H-flavin reductase/hemoglobin-like flavoprotein